MLPEKFYHTGSRRDDVRRERRTQPGEALRCPSLIPHRGGGSSLGSREPRSFQFIGAIIQLNRMAFNKISSMDLVLLTFIHIGCRIG